MKGVGTSLTEVLALKYGPEVDHQNSLKKTKVKHGATIC